MRLAITLILFFSLVAGACSFKGESKLSKALSGAVREKKISQKKMDKILIEYDKLRDDDKSVAHEYAEKVFNAIEMGGDSTHIDVARNQVLKGKTKKARV